MTKPLASIFERLRAILIPYATDAIVVHDSAEHFYLNASKPDSKGKPVFLAAAKIGAGKVVFHLMPLYYQPELLTTISPELKKRMQGKSCFNFAMVDEELFCQLEALTKQAILEP